MEVRRLKTKDFFTVATMLSKMAGDAMHGMADAANNSAQVGATFISSALKYAESDLKAWLSDLVGIKPDEFDELPFDAPLEIVEQLADKENLVNFFLRVKGLRDKITKSAT